MTTLGEYAKVQGGFAYKSKDFIGASEYRVLKIKNVRFGTIDYSEPAFVPKNIAESTINWKLKEGDILISMTGSGPNAPQSLVGRVARVWKNEPDAWFNQRVGRINLVDNKKIHPDFIFYWLSLPQNQDFLVANSSGSANQANISGKTIESLPTPIVDYEISSAIAKIARELDEKIILNTQINQTLEQIAQAIFKSWFVDFDPVKAKIEALAAGGNADDAELAAMGVISAKTLDELNSLKASNPEQFNKLAQTATLFPAAMQDSELGEIPEGWEVSDIASCTTELRRGISPKYIEEGGVLVINQKCIRNHTIDFSLARRNDSSKRKVDGREIVIGDVLVNSTGVGTLGRLAPIRFLNETTVADSHVTVVRANTTKISKSFLAGLMLTNEAYIEASGAGSTGQTELRKQVLEDIKFVKPLSAVDRLFDEIVSNFNAQIAELEKQRVTLSLTRDALLPKLLSGELVGE
ncbi:restriction endonuclease subunit S [Vibrio anguillarum]|uniref:restriction endonuclease subunit S n=1 Tax=Vibrio anguillarum TaxID=55601 RepID=UPI000B539794|nr:restriction endonuclease subunit S [Vibrio anguillarum]ASF99288.1 restriction endonuclease subunit S [Vibrio anguillarum]MBT2949177.1 restriction endonuclease subunit S [Vibrio anguillarum]